MRRHAHLLGTAALLAGTASFALARAPDTHGAVFSVSPPTTVSLAALAAAARSPDRAPALFPMPPHRFPDGSVTRAPWSELPVIARSNVDVVDAQPRLTNPPATVGGFTGLTDGTTSAAVGGESEPPDQGLAVNNGQVVEIINNAIQIFDATGKALTQPLSNYKFFAVPTGNNLTDPHAVYDPVAKRWYVEELEYGSTFYGFAVAASTTANPLGTYHVFHVSAQTQAIPQCGGSCLPDYPQVGFDASGFYIGADLFSNTTNKFITGAIYALPKAKLASGAAFSYALFTSPDFVIQPAIPAPGTPFVKTNGGTEYIMSARNLSDSSSNLRVFAMVNTAKLPTSPASLVLRSVDVPAETYAGTVPSTQPNVVGPYGKSVGAKSAPKIDGGYDGLGGGVKYANGLLYTALTSGSKDSAGLKRDVIAWFVVKPAQTATDVTATITAQGYVTPPTGSSLSYPGMAIDKIGNGIIGATLVGKTAPGGFPSTGFVELLSNALAGTFTVTGKGNTSDDGFSGYGTGGVAGIGRWGDYASAAVDPTTGYYWAGNEYIPDAATFPRGASANWGTFITKVH